jgi:hypothetical protein
MLFSWLWGQENGALGPIACYSGRYAHLVGVVALDTKSFNLLDSETKSRTVLQNHFVILCAG